VEIIREETLVEEVENFIRHLQVVFDAEELHTEVVFA
jgi:hypothetical protein